MPPAGAADLPIQSTHYMATLRPPAFSFYFPSLLHFCFSSLGCISHSIIRITPFLMQSRGALPYMLIDSLLLCLHHSQVNQ